MEILNNPLVSIASTTGVLTTVTDTETAKSCIIAIVVYVLQRGIVKLWDKVFKTKPISE